MLSKKGIVTLIISCLIYFMACEYDYFPQPPPPKVAEETQILEAEYTSELPSSLNHSFWETANYRVVSMSDLATEKLYDDGALNMTGTYNGKEDFNKGNDAELIIKAAYDNSKLYILLEWSDNTLNVSKASKVWDGSEDILKPDIVENWTSQRNSDAVALVFNLDNAYNSTGDFNTIGCMASCHNGEMKPESGKVDLWYWGMAFSEPMGYAMDLFISADSGISNDEGISVCSINSSENTYRSGPEYEWDGNSQIINKPDGSSSILDPAFFLLNKTEFIGNPETGDSIYLAKCASCHGENGQGDDGPPFNNPGLANRLSRTAIEETASSESHSGYLYYVSLNNAQKNDLIARIRGFAGVPGIYFNTPDGSSADVIASSDKSLIKIDTKSAISGYKLLLTRDLVTENEDDIQFDLASQSTYAFGIALMDNDGINHIGSVLETLTFMSKQ